MAILVDLGIDTMRYVSYGKKGYWQTDLDWDEFLLNHPQSAENTFDVGISSDHNNIILFDIKPD